MDILSALIKFRWWIMAGALVLAGCQTVAERQSVSQWKVGEYVGIGMGCLDTDSGLALMALMGEEQVGLPSKCGQFEPTPVRLTEMVAGGYSDGNQVGALWAGVTPFGLVIFFPLPDERPAGYDSRPVREAWNYLYDLANGARHQSNRRMSGCNSTERDK